MDEKITIIEGPPPTFEVVNDGWVTGLLESPALSDVALTRLRTFNGHELVERCHRSWRKQSNIQLEFRTLEGLEAHAPIVAARTLEVDDGQVLLLWVRMINDEIELELGYDDDSGEELDDDYSQPE